MFRMIRTCGTCVVIRSLGIVCISLRFLLFCISVILLLVFAILVHIVFTGFYWSTLFRDAYTYCKNFEQCQKTGTISHRNEMPQQPLLFYEIFDVWGIDFMGPFPVSFGFVYILLVVDYVSKWVEAKAT